MTIYDKRFRQTAAIGSALALAVSMAACSSSDSTSKDAGNSDEIVIGFALSQSGNMAPFDVEPGNAAKLRIAEINKDGGVAGRKIRVVSKDVRSNPETVGTATTELIAEGVDIVVTPCDFDLSAPGATIAQTSKIPAVSICAGDPKMADTTTLGDYAFSANTGSDVEGGTGASYAFDKGWKNAYVLQDESIEYTKSAGKYFAATFEDLGGKVVGKDAFPGGDNVNISSQVAQIRALNPQPDFVYVASWNPGGATAIRQLREGGVDLPVIGPNALDGQTLLDIVGKAKDIYYTAFACYVYCTGQDAPELDKFVKNYAKEYDKPPASSYALLGYNMISAFADALKRVDDLSGPSVRDALAEGVATETPVGEVTYFSKTCHKIVDMPLTIVGVSDGKMTFQTQQRVKTIPDVGDNNSCAG